MKTKFYSKRGSPIGFLPVGSFLFQIKLSQMEKVWETNIYILEGGFWLRMQFLLTVLNFALYCGHAYYYSIVFSDIQMSMRFHHILLGSCMYGFINILKLMVCLYKLIVH